MLCFHVAQAGKHFVETNVSEQNQKHFLRPQQMLLAPVKTGKQSVRNKNKNCNVALHTPC